MQVSVIDEALAVPLEPVSFRKPFSIGPNRGLSVSAVACVPMDLPVNQPKDLLFVIAKACYHKGKAIKKCTVLPALFSLRFLVSAVCILPAR